MPLGYSFHARNTMDWVGLWRMLWTRSKNGGKSVLQTDQLDQFVKSGWPVSDRRRWFHCLSVAGKGKLMVWVLMRLKERCCKIKNRTLGQGSCYLQATSTWEGMAWQKPPYNRCNLGRVPQRFTGLTVTLRTGFLSWHRGNFCLSFSF